MGYDYSKLKGRIVEKFKTQEAFAKAIGMSCSTLNFKINNRSDWTAPEIVRACELLEIPLADAHLYFFNTLL